MDWIPFFVRFDGSKNVIRILDLKYGACFLALSSQDLIYETALDLVP